MLKNRGACVRYRHSTADVRVNIFKTYCAMCCGSFWGNFKLATLHRIKEAYDTILRNC